MSIGRVEAIETLLTPALPTSCRVREEAPEARCILASGLLVFVPQCVGAGLVLVAKPWSLSPCHYPSVRNPLLDVELVVNA